MQRTDPFLIAVLKSVANKYRKIRFSSAVKETFGWAAPLRDLSISFLHGHVSASFFGLKRDLLLLFNEPYFSFRQTGARAEMPAEKESRKVLPHAADIPKTTRSYNKAS